ncbi:B12-binding domain-containing radical SAM protein [Candidatus Omnitrophota bacterium]
MRSEKGYKRVLLIVPGYKKSHYEYAGLPAGVGYISEALDRAGIDQEIVDMRLGYSYGQLKKRIEEFKPDLIGASMMSFRHKDHYELLDKIKADFQDVDIAAGGPHLSTFRDKALKVCDSIDYGFTLEGEDAIIELCSGEKTLEDIKGLLYRKEGEIRYTGDRDFILDLDNKGFPKYRFFERDKYPNFRSLVTSRGCPHSCIFCPVQLTIGKRLRVRSTESILGEIDYWYGQGVRVFNVVDDNFTFYKDRIMAICEGIKNRGYKDISFSCRNGVRADTVDREMLSAMKDIGFNYLAFGVESGSDRMLEVIKKGEKLEAIDSAVKEACDLGYMVTLFFIMGLPTETEEDVEKSLEFAMKYPVFDVRFYNPIPFPGTELYDWVEENGYFDESLGDYLNSFSHWINKPVFGTPELPIDSRKVLYERINDNIKKHTLKTKISFAKDMEKMFTDLGIPAPISKVLGRVYYTEFFQKYVIETGLASKMKKFLKLLKGGSRT